MKNIDSVFWEYVKYLKIPLSKDYCKDLLLSHPSFPSILSLSDTMNRLSITNYVMNITHDELSSIEYPYLLHSDLNGGELKLIKNDQDLKLFTINIKSWTGVIIQAEKTKYVFDSENSRYLLKDKLTRGLYMSLSLTMLFLFTYCSLSFTIPATILFDLTSILGIGIGYILLAKELGIKYNRIEKFCVSSSLSSCDAVLMSNKSTIYKFIKVSDIVLAYFLAEFTLITLLHNNSMFPEIILSLFMLNLVAATVSMYTIYYQKFIIKFWCKLCISVSTINLIQFFCTLTILNNKLLMSISLAKFLLPITITFALLVFFSLCVILIKQNIKDKSLDKDNYFAAQRIKLKSNVFSSFLFAQEVINTNYFSQEIIAGNPDAAVKLLIVSNLFCKPCQKEHEIIAELLNSYHDQISVTFRFLESNDAGKELYSSTQYFLQYWIENNDNYDDKTNFIVELIKTWYNIGDLSKFVKEKPLKNRLNYSVGKELAGYHDKWSINAKITHTPTVIINNYLLPDNYSLNDLKILIPEFADFSTTECIIW